MFIDQVSIRIEAGRGGDGAVAFRREKFVPKGGPAGGDGGKGGDIVVQANSSLMTLKDLRYKRELRAENGRNGGPKKMHGRGGREMSWSWCLWGTLVYDDRSGELLGDLIEDGQKLIVAKGGRGGQGNARFATSTNRTPRYAESGREGGNW